MNGRSIEHPEAVYEKEKNELAHTERIVIGGSVALALKLEKDIALARDVDVFHITDRRYDDSIALRSFRDIEDLEAQMPGELAERVRAFIERHGLEGKAIQVTSLSDNTKEYNRVYDDEPEVVLWDRYWELKRSITPAKNEEEIRELQLELNQLRGLGRGDLDYDEADRLSRQLRQAQDVHNYEHGQLWRGGVPHLIQPRGRSLAKFMRAVDITERFGLTLNARSEREIEFIDRQNRYRVVVPPELPEANLPDGGVSESPELDDLVGSSKAERYRYYGRSRASFTPPKEEYAIDQPLLDVVTKKADGLGEYVPEHLPNLSGRLRVIKEAGGIRAFVAQEYGEGYLDRGHVDPEDPKLIAMGLGGDEQRLVLSSWDQLGARGTSFINSLPEYASYYAGWQGRYPDKAGGVSPEGLFREIESLAFEDVVKDPSPERRRQAYDYLLMELSNANNEGERYKELRDRLRGYLDQEPRKSVRNKFIKELAQTASSRDPELMHEWIEDVREANRELKAEGTSRKGIFSDKAMVAVRGLMGMSHPDAYAALFGTIANPNVDPRMKKAVLKRLGSYELGVFYGEAFHAVERDLGKGARSIPWEDYGALYQVFRIPNKELRERVWSDARLVFSHIRGDSEFKSITEARQKLAPEMPAEFFFTLSSVLNAREKSSYLADWDRFLGGIKSRTLRDSFLHSVTQFHEQYTHSSEFAGLITEKVIRTDTMSDEYARIARRLIDKTIFLKKLERDQGISGSGESSGLLEKLGKRFGGGKGERVDIETRLRNATVPSLFEASIDSELVERLYELTGRKDLSADKLQRLFANWGEIGPVFVYGANLRKGSRAAELLGEMLVHMDPPDLEEWKGWRYDTKDKYVARQLEGLTDEQIKEYRTDRLTDLGEVLVGLLPEDKPDRIREKIMHAVSHDWQLSDEDASDTREEHRASSVLRNAFPADVRSADRADYMEYVVSVLEKLQGDRSEIETLLSRKRDIELLKEAPQIIADWKRREMEKRREFPSYGLPEDADPAAIDERIQMLREQAASPAEISRLARLKPNGIPEKTGALLKRYDVTPETDTNTFIDLSEKVTGEMREHIVSDRMRKIRERYLKGEPMDEESPMWRPLLKDLQAVELLIKLTMLTPRLIAYNKISVEKKRTSLRETLERLRSYFGERPEILETLDDVEGIINEFSEPLGRDHLMVVETDNPLALLTVGKYPYGATSCQHYEHGEEVLTAYMADGDKRICYLIDVDRLPDDVRETLQATEEEQDRLKLFSERIGSFLEAAVARRIIKIVRDEKTEQPQLFLEPVYTPLSRERTTHTLDAYAKTHLESALRIPIVKGTKKDQGSPNVKVAESRHGRQYEDGESGGPGGGGGGLGILVGEYTMPARLLQPEDYVPAVSNTEKPLTRT